jgi:hypothetical protein
MGQSSFSGDQVMKIWHSVLIGIPSGVICLGLLFLIYPWSTYYNNFTYGLGVTLGSYLLLSLLVGLVGSIVIGGLSFAKLSALGKCALSGLLSFAVLFICSLLLGPGGVDLFNTRVEGIFFSEWKFVTFIVAVALPISILNAILAWWVARLEPRERKSVSTMQAPDL